MKLLWRMVPVPTLCFDGDSAGQKAAFRAVDTVLPHLKPGMSVSFAFLPDGLDPDDLIRQQGAKAMAAVLSKTRPLIDVLWDREVKAGPLETPEQRAALEARLRGLSAGIADPTVRSHYDRELRDRLYALGRTTSQNRSYALGSKKPLQGGSYARPVLTADWKAQERARLDGRPKPFYRGFNGTPPPPPGAGPELSSLSQPVQPRLRRSAKLARSVKPKPKQKHAADVALRPALKPTANQCWLLPPRSASTMREPLKRPRRKLRGASCAGALVKSTTSEAWKHGVVSPLDALAVELQSVTSTAARGQR